MEQRPSSSLFGDSDWFKRDDGRVRVVEVLLMSWAASYLKPFRAATTTAAAVAAPGVWINRLVSEERLSLAPQKSRCCIRCWR